MRYHYDERILQCHWFNKISNKLSENSDTDNGEMECATGYIQLGFWLCRASDPGARGRGFDTYLRRVVSLSKDTFTSRKVLDW